MFTYTCPFFVYIYMYVLGIFDIFLLHLYGTLAIIVCLVYIRIVLTICSISLRILTLNTLMYIWVYYICICVFSLCVNFRCVTRGYLCSICYYSYHCCACWCFFYIFLLTSVNFDVVVYLCLLTVI